MPSLSGTGMVFWFFMIAMVISFSEFSSGLIINEIMYAPDFNERYNEWIEVYNDEDVEIDFSNVTLCEKTLEEGYVGRNGEVHKEDGFILESGGYALITDGGSGTEVYGNYNVDDDAIALHVSVASLCGGLSNTGKTIKLERGSEIFDQVAYSDDAEKGYSLALIEGEFVQSSEIHGSPGRENDDSPSQNTDGGSDDNNGNGADDDPDEDNFDGQTGEDEGFLTLSQSDDDKPLENLNYQKREKIILNNPAVRDPGEKENPGRYVSVEEKVRLGVVFSFFVLLVLLVILLAFRKL